MHLDPLMQIGDVFEVFMTFAVFLLLFYFFYKLLNTPEQMCPSVVCFVSDTMKGGKTAC